MLGRLPSATVGESHDGTGSVPVLSVYVQFNYTHPHARSPCSHITIAVLVLLQRFDLAGVTSYDDCSRRVCRGPSGGCEDLDATLRVKSLQPLQVGTLLTEHFAEHARVDTNAHVCHAPTIGSATATADPGSIGAIIVSPHTCPSASPSARARARDGSMPFGVGCIFDTPQPCVWHATPSTFAPNW